MSYPIREAVFSRFLDDKLPSESKEVCPMSDPICIYSREELDRLRPGAIEQLRQELHRQIDADKAITAIIRADERAKDLLKERLNTTYNSLLR